MVSEFACLLMFDACMWLTSVRTYVMNEETAIDFRRRHSYISAMLISKFAATRPLPLAAVDCSENWIKP